MTPPAVADIRGGGREPGLESQGRPGDAGVAGEAQGIAVTAGAAEAAEDQGGMPRLQRMQVTGMVQHKQRIHARIRGAAFLLPVQPPEIHPHVLQGGDDRVFHRADHFPVRGVKGKALPGGGILPHGLRHSGIQFLTGTDAVRRVIVQGYLQSLAMQPGQQLLRLREFLPVPGIARPSGAVFRVDIRHMPVHIQHGDRQGNLLPLKAFHQLHVFLLGIGIVAAPPVAQGKAGHRRHAAGQAQIVPDGPPEITAVGKEVQILSGKAVGQQAAGFIHTHGGAVIQRRVSAEGQDAVLQRDFPVRLVQGAGSSTEGLHGIPVMPDAGIDGISAFQFRGKPCSGERAPVVPEADVLRFHDQPMFRFLHGILRHGELPAQCHLRGCVPEAAVRVILQPQQPVRQHSDAIPIPADDSPRIRCRPDGPDVCCLHASSFFPKRGCRFFRQQPRGFCFNRSCWVFYSPM